MSCEDGFDEGVETDTRGRVRSPLLAGENGGCVPTSRSGLGGHGPAKRERIGTEV